MNALKDLEATDGIVFNMNYQRQPFFLRGAQRNIDRWMDELGLPRDATRGEVNKKMGWDRKGGIDVLFAQAGLERDMDVVNMSQISDTMNSHRLAWYATSVSDEKGELMWSALSRRYFQGKDTAVRPLRLDSRAMLLECASEVGLDPVEAERVLDGDDYRAEITDTVERMHAAGLQSIPVLCFEVEGVAQGSWLDDPRVASDMAGIDPKQLARNFKASGLQGREIHHGSGSMAAFRELLLRLHESSPASCNL
eukprot:TRINITY_DN33849_c0_g1_i1.p1 TRINITY_DN33849_c0_g1~~TRINITY_DN33849_c0_g1_i1.p1  ORF type:complete len:252 (+),score=45.41 TRINITY_DN33849_c0_g1_i1:183-938(+)